MMMTQRYRRGHYSFPWISPFSLNLYLIMRSVKQGVIKYHFLNLLYDSTWDWTPVSRTIGEHSYHYANIYIYILKASRTHSFTRLLVAIRLFPLSLLVSLRDSIQCLHRFNECKFLQVGQHWCVHVQESIGERRFYLGSNISSTESNVNIDVDKAWTSIDRLTTIIILIE